MSQNQGWGQPQGSPGWGQQPPTPPPPGAPPGQPSGQGPPNEWAPPPPPSSGSNWPTKYCHACGGSIDARAEVCPQCGVRQYDAASGEAKSRPLAILLALLLGTFGIQRFYVGPTSWGIIYLVFFWTGIPQFLAWLEAIYWLTRSDADWARMYGGPVRGSNGAAIGCLWVLAVLPIIGLILVLLSIPGLIFMGGEISEILSEIEMELDLYTPAP